MVLSSVLHHFSLSIVPQNYMSFALGERGSEQGEEHPTWQSQTILGITENNLFQPQPVILPTHNAADTVALDSSSLIENKMAEVKHEILCYFKNLPGNSKPRDNWTLQ